MLVLVKDVGELWDEKGEALGGGTEGRMLDSPLVNRYIEGKKP